MPGSRPRRSVTSSSRRFGPTIPAAIRGLVLGMMGGDRAHLPARFPIQGVRTAQQDIYDLLAQARSLLYSGDDVGRSSAIIRSMTIWVFTTTGSATGPRSTSRSTSATR